MQCVQSIFYGAWVTYVSQKNCSIQPLSHSATQPLCQSSWTSHSATLPEWLDQPLSSSATLPEWLDQPLSHSATLPEWLDQPLSHSATQPLCQSGWTSHSATQPLSHSARVAGPGTLGEWVSGWVAGPATLGEWLSGWVAGVIISAIARSIILSVDADGCGMRLQLQSYAIPWTGLHNKIAQSWKLRKQCCTILGVVQAEFCDPSCPIRGRNLAPGSFAIRRRFAIGLCSWFRLYLKNCLARG